MRRIGIRQSQRLGLLRRREQCDRCRAAWPARARPAALLFQPKAPACFAAGVVVTDPSEFGGCPVTSTSTRIPGSTNPAMPVTSFTRTVTARIPTGMMGARPRPLPRAASRPSRIGSSMRMLLISGRSITSSGLAESAFGESRDWHFAELDVGRLHRRSHREWPGGQNDVPQVGGLGLLGPSSASRHLVKHA